MGGGPLGRLCGAHHAAGVRKEVTLGGSHLSLPGAWAGGPNAGAPGEEQKLETGSVCGLHDNKGGGDSIHNSGTNCPSSPPARAGTRFSPVPASRIGLPPPSISLSPRIMGFKCLI